MQFEITPFLQGIQKSILDLAGINIENVKIAEYTETEFLSDYTCSIGLLGRDRASLILTVSEQAAIYLTTLITGKQITGNEKIITDTIGEILNIAVGVAQKQNAEKFDFSLPISIKGKKHLIHVFSDKKTFRAVFLLKGEEVCLYLTNSQVLE